LSRPAVNLFNRLSSPTEATVDAMDRHQQALWGANNLLKAGTMSGTTKQPSCGKPMKKDELVGCFRPGSFRTKTPDFLETRETVRAWKKEGKGYFHRNDYGPGHVFQLTSVPETVDDELMGTLSRGSSLKIDEPNRPRQLGMMSRFVMGDMRAIVAVNSYKKSFVTITAQDTSFLTNVAMGRLNATRQDEIQPSPPTSR
jgi:hypothetical protein